MENLEVIQFNKGKSVESAGSEIEFFHCQLIHPFCAVVHVGQTLLCLLSPLHRVEVRVGLLKGKKTKKEKKKKRKKKKKKKRKEKAKK